MKNDRREKLLRAVRRARFEFGDYDPLGIVAIGVALDADVDELRDIPEFCVDVGIYRQRADCLLASLEDDMLWARAAAELEDIGLYTAEELAETRERWPKHYNE